MRNHLLLCLALGCGLAACDDSDDTTTEASDAAIAEGNTRGEALTSVANTDLGGATDDQAIAVSADVVARINVAEIAAASFVLTRTSDDDVRDLASQIQADHEDNNERLQGLIGDRGLVATDSTTGDALQAEADTGMADLMAAGSADLDRVYVKMQVSMHQEAFVVVGVLENHVQDADMQDYLLDTRAAIADHRDHASDVLNNL